MSRAVQQSIHRQRSYANEMTIEPITLLHTGVDMVITGPIVLVAGARPNFMKVAPIMRELTRRNLPHILVHTGQHYDENMSQIFFDDLGIPAPDIHLEIGSASHAVQTAKIMVAFEQVCRDHSPSCVVVVGDVNSTVACALVGSKLGIPCAHVEAGLRSFDRNMPEELNRIVTDRLCEILLTPSLDGNEHLQSEGIPPEWVHHVGNVMIDTLVRNLEKAKHSEIIERLGLSEKGYCLVTLHRPSNVDDEESFKSILTALQHVGSQISLVFPMHPRTRARAETFGIMAMLEKIPGIVITEPLGYLDFLSLMASAKLVMTDSGGLQEETTALGVPCLTLRENTERPITIDEGTNTLVGCNPAQIIAAADDILDNGGKSGKIPDLWEGDASKRIVEVLIQRLS